MDPDWRLAGTYLEACNCEAICPCRRIGGEAGGRSTYGECVGALSWWIEEGRDGELDLSRLGVVLALRYHDDEPGSPWRYVLYLDERAGERERAALTEIFTGRRGGTPMANFPWVWKESELLAVHPARIEIDHRPRRGWFRAGGEVVMQVAREAGQESSVSCVIPGHDHAGTEVIAELLRLDTEAASCELRMRCGFQTRFDYSATVRRGNGSDKATGGA